MSRIQLAGQFGAGVGQYASGAVNASAAGTIYLTGTATPVTTWSAASGGTSNATGAFVTDSQGRVPGWVDRGGSDVYVDITIPPATTVTVLIPGTSGGGASGPTIVSAGSLGATHTLDFASTEQEVWLVGTLTANCTITISNRVAGCRAILLLTQNGTGNWTLTISDGTGSQPVAISPTVGAFDPVLIDCPNGTDIYVSAISIPGPGGGGVTLGNFSDSVTADALSTLPCDGAKHTLAVVKASPPSWLDGSGNIIAPGLYAVGASIQIGAGPTTPGLWITLNEPFNLAELVSVDGLATSGRGLGFEDVQSLGVADLSYLAAVDFYMPTDATANVYARAFAVRLAH